MEVAVILELVSPYLSVAVVALFWVLAMRPVLRLIHARARTGPVLAPRRPGAGARWRSRARR